jgi:micrococcal nuclease
MALRLTILVAAVAVALGAPSTATAKTCSDYTNQADAQAGADTFDGDGDGIFCEALPCPCSAEKGGSSTPPVARPPSAGKTYTYSGRITRVVDGDTLKVKIKKSTKTVRVIGIDTPESHKPNVPLECGAKEATSSAFQWAFAQQLDNDGDGLFDHGRQGRKVTLRTDNTQSKTDKYGRLLAYVSRGGKDFGRSQISNGWAEIFVFENNPFKRFQDYKSALQGAQAAVLGAWTLCGGDFHSGQ